MKKIYLIISILLIILMVRYLNYNTHNENKDDNMFTVNTVEDKTVIKVISDLSVNKKEYTFPLYLTVDKRVYYKNDEKVYIEELNGSDDIYITDNYLISLKDNSVYIYYRNGEALVLVDKLENCACLDSSAYDNLVVLYENNQCVLYDLIYDNGQYNRIDNLININDIKSVGLYDKTAFILTNTNKVYGYGVDLVNARNEHREENILYEIDTENVGEIVDFACKGGVFVKNISGQWFSANCYSTNYGCINPEPLKFNLIEGIENHLAVIGCENLGFGYPVLSLDINGQIYSWGTYVGVDTNGKYILEDRHPVAQNIFVGINKKIFIDEYNIYLV